MRNTDTTNAVKKWVQLGIDRHEEYNKNPKLCKQCGKPIPYRERLRQNYCSQRCGAIGNSNRGNPVPFCKECGKKLSDGAKGIYCKECNKIKYTENKMDAGEPISASTLRDYLKRTRGHRCEECGLETWRGVKIPLDNHHIDGDWKNNALSNLKLLCKNCHAITDTYGAKNKGRGRPFTKKCKDEMVVASKN